MNADFNKILVKLQADPTITAVSIFDLTDFKIITKGDKRDYLFGSEIIAKYGSIKDFFEKIKADGHSHLQIQEVRKNGTSVKKPSAPFQVNFAEKTTVATPTQPQAQTAMLHGAQSVGLGFADIMSLNTDSVLKARLEVELEATKRELAEVKQQRDELKEQVLQDKYNADKASNTTQTITGVLPIVLEALKGFAPQPTGLAQPQPQTTENLSETKQHLLQLVPSLSDALVTAILNVIEKLRTDSDGSFYQMLKIAIENKQPQTKD